MEIALIQIRTTQLLRRHLYDNILERRLQNTKYHEWQGSIQYLQSNPIFYEWETTEWYKVIYHRVSRFAFLAFVHPTAPNNEEGSRLLEARMTKLKQIDVLSVMLHMERWTGSVRRHCSAMFPCSNFFYGALHVDKPPQGSGSGDPAICHNPLLKRLRAVWLGLQSLK